MKFLVSLLILFFKLIPEGLCETSISEAPESLNQYKINPQIMLSLPQPLSLGVEIYREDRSLRFFGNSGYFTLPLSNGSKQFTIFTVRGGVRYFPWGQNFFGAIGPGFRYVRLSTNSISSFKIDDEVMATHAAIQGSSLFIAPSLGAQFKLSRSLSFGFDLGIQIPIFAFGSMELENKETGVNSNNSDYLRLDSGPYIARVAKLIIPEVTLFRLTWQLP